MPTRSTKEERVVGTHEVDVSSLDKVMFPESGITKGEVVDYYEAIAPLMLAHIKDRPLTLQRFPAGIGRHGFFQKEAPEYYPDYIQRVPVEHDDGEVVDNLTANNPETLVYLANQNVIVMHNWFSKRADIRKPDRIAFDFDPNGTATFAMVKKAAQLMREKLESLGLKCWPMITGSRGIHVVVPIKPVHDYEFVADWTHALADRMAEEHPKLLTTEFYKDERGDRIFVDWLRNQYAQTAVAPYSIRAKEPGPVAVPLAWDEVGSRSLKPNKFTLRDAKALLKRGDPWDGFAKAAAKLPALTREAGG